MPLSSLNGMRFVACLLFAIILASLSLRDTIAGVTVKIGAANGKSSDTSSRRSTAAAATVAVVGRLDRKHKKRPPRPFAPPFEKDGRFNHLLSPTNRHIAQVKYKTFFSSYYVHYKYKVFLFHTYCLYTILSTII